MPVGNPSRRRPAASLVVGAPSNATTRDAFSLCADGVGDSRWCTVDLGPGGSELRRPAGLPLKTARSGSGIRWRPHRVVGPNAAFRARQGVALRWRFVDRVGCGPRLL
jgi:hypothetical protein